MMLFSSRRCSVWLLWVLVSVFSPAVLGFSGVYSHYSEKEDLSAVLADFARSQGYNAKISPALKGTLSGRFVNLRPEDFLEVLRSSFGVRYFTQGRIINFFHDSEWGQTVYRPSSVTTASLLSSLRKSKVVSPDLPVTVNDDGLLVIEGPESYVSGVLSAAMSFDQGQANDLVMKVFRLKHAKVNDVTVTTNSRTTVIPGVATLLQRMINGSGGITSSSVAVSVNSRVVPGLRGTGLSSTAPKDSPSQAGSATGSVSESQAQSFTPNIIADERLNALLIYDYKSRMPFYQGVLDQIDVPVRMVELHAAVVDVDVDATESLGIALQGGVSSGNWTVDAARGSPEGATTGVFPRNQGGVFSTVFNTDHANFMLQVSALESEGRAKTLGRPSVLTVENVEATLENTTTNYVPVSGNESSDLFSVTAGTVLQVNPRIIDSGDGLPPVIQMIITLKTNQDSTGSDISSASSTTYIPSVKETVINTQALVRQGQSLLIGGYYVETVTKRDEGLPVLKDIPLLGRLFSTETDVHQKRERILLITPRIVSFEDLSTLPQYADSGFYKSAGQTNYANRDPEELGLRVHARPENTSGCASTRSASPEPSETPGQPPQVK